MRRFIRIGAVLASGGESNLQVLLDAAHGQNVENDLGRLSTGCGQRERVHQFGRVESKDKRRRESLDRGNLPDLRGDARSDEGPTPG